MSKEYAPQIRIISVDHARTATAERLLRHEMARRGLHYKVMSVFCHLESGRCGVESGKVALEVDGRIIWKGAELTEKLAASFWDGLPEFIEMQKKEFGIA